MSKSYDERIRDTVGAIRDICGEVDARQIEVLLDGMTKQQLKALSESISIGFKGSSSDARVKRLRAAKRAVVLASNVLPGAQAVAFGTLSQTSDIAVAQQLRRLFPYRARPLLGNFDGRGDWDHACADPKQHDPSTYRYLVHGIMAAASRVAAYTQIKGKTTKETESEEATYKQAKTKFSGIDKMLVESEKDVGGQRTFTLNARFFVQYLRDPDVLKSVIISTSLIDQNHRATYYPFGFILNVPAVNIYSASSRDQGVSNRTDDILGEFQRIFNSNNVGNRILSPKQVLDGTPKPEGKTGYNEVVVVGTSPEGKHVSVSGLFVKVNAAGKLWVDPAQKVPYVTPEIVTLVSKLAADRDLPIIAIEDNAGGVATKPIAAKDCFDKIRGIA